jgi:hypothetical protein
MGAYAKMEMHGDEIQDYHSIEDSYCGFLGYDTM